MLGFPNLVQALANAVPFYLAGSNFSNLSASIYTQVKTGVGIVGGLSVNTGGTGSAIALFDGTSSVVTMTQAAPGVINWAGHPFIAGSAVRFTTTGALYTGLTAGTTYYVSSAGLTANSFQVADTQAHAIAGTNSIATTGSESGVQTAWDVSNPIGTFSTTAQDSVNCGPNGARFQNGLIAASTDGGGAADTTVYFI